MLTCVSTPLGRDREPNLSYVHQILDISRLRTLGWEPRVGLVDGIRMTYEWYLENPGQ